MTYYILHQCHHIMSLSSLLLTLINCMKGHKSVVRVLLSHLDHDDHLDYNDHLNHDDHLFPDDYHDFGDIGDLDSKKATRQYVHCQRR